MIKVAQNPSLKKTLLSLAQTRATSKVGGTSEAFLDEQMRINMTPLNNTGGQAASRSEIKESEIAAAAAASGRSEAEYRQLLQDNGIKIIP